MLCWGWICLMLFCCCFTLHFVLARIFVLSLLLEGILIFLSHARTTKRIKTLNLTTTSSQLLMNFVSIRSAKLIWVYLLTLIGALTHT